MLRLAGVQVARRLELGADEIVTGIRGLMQSTGVTLTGTMRTPWAKRQLASGVQAGRITARGGAHAASLRYAQQRNWRPTKQQKRPPSAPHTPPAVQTGLLKRSVQRERAEIGRDRVSVRAGILNKVVYAAALEFGYRPRHLIERPYLIPGFNRALPAIKRVMGVRS